MTAPTLEFKPFYHKEFIEQALQDCETAGYQALFMPGVADARVEGGVPWGQLAITKSPIITGTPTGEKEAFVVYWHQPTYFATPKGLRAAKQQGLVNGAGRFDQQIFDTIYRQASQEKPHLIIPHRKLIELPSDSITLKAAATDLRVIASLDGAERVARYLSTHAKEYITQIIGVLHNDDLNNDSPLARLLCISNVDLIGLDGKVNLDGPGIFLGAREVQNFEEEIKIIGDRHVYELVRSMHQRRNLR